MCLRWLSRKKFPGGSEAGNWWLPKGIIFSRAKKGSKSTGGKPAKTRPKPFVETRHLYYGATYLLNEFANELGLTADLRQCFPETYKQLLSVVFYLILEDNNPLYRFEKWHLTHKHPYGEDITSPRSSELFASITDNQVNKFFRLQGKRRVEDEYWAYDSTSISSYSETLAQIQYGKNKEDDKLPQLNLLLVFGEESGLPFYYRKLAGNIPDSKTVKHLLEDLDILGFGKTKFVMDRGFYSEDNINGLYRDHIKFLGRNMALQAFSHRLCRISAGTTAISLLLSFCALLSYLAHLRPMTWNNAGRC